LGNDLPASLPGIDLPAEKRILAGCALILQNLMYNAQKL
jgi:hypothetical protein